MTRTLKALLFITLILLGSSTTIAQTTRYYYPDILYVAYEDGSFSAMGLAKKVEPPAVKKQVSESERIVQIFPFKNSDGEGQDVFNNVLFVGEEFIKIVIGTDLKVCPTLGGVVRSVDWPWINFTREDGTSYSYKCEWNTDNWRRRVANTATVKFIESDAENHANPPDSQCVQSIDGIPSELKELCLTESGILWGTRQEFFAAPKASREFVTSLVVAITKSITSPNTIYVLRSIFSMAEIVELTITPNGSTSQKLVTLTNAPDTVGQWLAAGELGVYFVSKNKAVHCFLFQENRVVDMTIGATAIAIR